MHDFFKKIFGPGKPTSQVTLPFEAVPEWLTEKESAAKAALVSDTYEPIIEIQKGIANLQLIVNNIAGTEHDPAIHPKLRTIAKNSLPQFVKAMKVSLHKDIPDDPVEFYPVAAECVKNCLQNIRGQGRYLQAIFPEDMKAIRHGIDTIGRGINTINPLLATYRREMAEVEVARALFDEITDLKSNFNASEEKVKRSHTRIAEITRRRAVIETEQNAMPQDPRMREIVKQKATLAELCQQRDNATRTYSTLSMTASHVFHKAEKIAAKQRHPSEIAILNAAMRILSDHELPDKSQLNDTLSAACPIAGRMIAAGEILLKNREERVIFSDTTQFCADICTAGSTLRKLEKSCRQAETALSTHPLVMKMESIEREKVQLAAILGKEEEGLATLQEWRTKTQKHSPELLQELKEKIAEMSGDNVQLQVTDQSLP